MLNKRWHRGYFCPQSGENRVSWPIPVTRDRTHPVARCRVLHVKA